MRKKYRNVVYKDRKHIIYEITYHEEYQRYQVMVRRNNEDKGFQPWRVYKTDLNIQGYWWEYLGDAIRDKGEPISFELRLNWPRLSKKVQGIITLLVRF